MVGNGFFMEQCLPCQNPIEKMPSETSVWFLHSPKSSECDVKDVPDEGRARSLDACLFDWMTPALHGLRQLAAVPTPSPDRADTCDGSGDKAGVTAMYTIPSHRPSFTSKPHAWNWFH